MTASLFANYRSAIDAVLELTDNAVDSRVPGRRLRVDLAIRPGAISITVVGGMGMGPSELERDYLRWGASRKRSGERIGRYGQGGKAAIGHLGDRFAIVASRAGDERAFGFEDDAYRDRTKLRTYELRDHVKPVASDLGYVRIDIGAVDRSVDVRRLPGRLADVYRPLLESGDVAIEVNRVAVRATTWDLVERHEFAVRGGGRLVRGWFGLLPEPPSSSVEPGIRVYHLGRLVGSPDWFGHPGPAHHPALNRLVGEVELPHVPVTMNKSDMDRDSPEWLAVEARLHALLRPIVRKLTRDEESRIDPATLKTADQVRRILARALRLLESGRLFESDAGTGAGDGPAGQLTLERAGSPSPEAAESSESAESDRPAGERTPPSGGAGRGRAAAEVVVRALDPRLRSAMVVEDGVRRVVINSRYPLFEVRKGDLWYQLETALREVCVTIPEATVPEFERKVNELLLVSIGLTERRRRSRRRTAQRPPKGAWA